MKGSGKEETDGYDSDSEGREVVKEEEAVEVTEETKQENPPTPVPEEKRQSPEVVQKQPSPPKEVAKKVEQIPPNVQSTSKTSSTERPTVVPVVKRELLQEMMERYMAELKPPPAQEAPRQERRPSAVSSSTQTDELPPPLAKKVEISPLQEALLVSDGVQGALQSVIKTHIQMVDEMNRLEWDMKKKWQQELDRLKGVVESPSMDRLTQLIEERSRKE